jgi:hypothetical protein
MTAWFVATARNVGAGVDWRLTSCATEEEAKAFAADAISSGCQVEAGTAPFGEQGRRIGWREAAAWAQSAEGASVRVFDRSLDSCAA